MRKNGYIINKGIFVKSMAIGGRAAQEDFIGIAILPFTIGSLLFLGKYIRLVS